MTHPARFDRTVRAVEAAGGVVRARDVAGLTRGQVRGAVSSGALRVLRPGIVVPSVHWWATDDHGRHRMAVDAALLSYPGSWVSHTSAGILHDLDSAIDQGALRTVHISRPGTTRREPGLHVHGIDVPQSHLTRLDGRQLTSLERTCIDLAAHRRLSEALVVMDAGLRRMIALSAHDLRRAVRDPDLRERARAAFDASVAPYTRHRWVTTVRQAVQWADPAAESGLESRSRAATLESDLPLPECGVPLMGDNGMQYWVDFWWKDRGLIGEADGLLKYDNPTRLRQEKFRQEALEGMGWRVVRWGFAEVVPNPAPLMRRLRHHL